jgi:hypothetical protein
MPNREDIERIEHIAATFLSLGPDARQAFLSKFAKSDAPEVADWLAIFSAYNK